MKQQLLEARVKELEAEITKLKLELSGTIRPMTSAERQASKDREKANS